MVAAWLLGQVTKATLLEEKYKALAKNTKSSYLGLTADFDRRQAVRCPHIPCLANPTPPPRASASLARSRLTGDRHFRKHGGR